MIGVMPPKQARARVKEVTERNVQVAETKSLALLENGRRVRVPAHVDVGAEIVVRMMDESYAGLASEEHT